MVKFSKKTGFTLIEAVVVMLVISIFLAASAKIMTQRRNKPIQINPHGVYECWYDKNEGQAHSRYIVSGVPTDTKDGCTFIPTLDPSFYHMYIIFPQERGYTLSSIQYATERVTTTFNLDEDTKIKLENSRGNSITYTSPSNDYDPFKKMISVFYASTNICTKRIGEGATAGVMIVW